SRRCRAPPRAPRRGGPPGRPAPRRRRGRRGRRGRRASARAARATGSSAGSSLVSSSPVPTRGRCGTHRRADVRARPGTRTAPTRRCIPARTAVLAASAAPPSGPASDSAGTAAAVIVQVRAGRAAVRSKSASSTPPASPASRAGCGRRIGPGGQGGTVRWRGRTPTLVGAAAARRGSSLCPMDDDTPAAPWPWTLRRRTGAALVLALTGPLIAATVWARHHGGAEEGALWPDAAAGSAAWLLSPLLLWRPVAVAAALTALAAVSPAATPAATLAALQVAQRR